MFGFLLELLRSNILMFALHFDSEGHFPKPLTAKEERDCFKLMSEHQKGTAPYDKAREELIAHNLRLVAHVAKKYNSPLSDPDDIISIGTIGLIKAVETFDSTKGNRFAAYGARCVENEILMYFRSAKKLQSEVHFDEPVDIDKNGNCLTLIDIIADDDMSVEDKCELDMQLKKLREKLGGLSEREREILTLRYGLGTAPPMPQREVAARLKISRSYVSRLEKKALENLKNQMLT